MLKAEKTPHTLSQEQCSLKAEFFVHGLTVVNGLNHLQSLGVISDNCVILNDVADVDCIRGIEWLRNKTKK